MSHIEQLEERLRAAEASAHRYLLALVDAQKAVEALRAEVAAERRRLWDNGQIEVEPWVAQQWTTGSIKGAR